MMFKVKTLKEAKHWFSNHNRGSLICVNNKNEKEINCYPEAKIFYITKMTSPHQISLLIESLYYFEQSIEATEKNIKKYKSIPQARIDEIDPNGHIAKAIVHYEENIINCKNAIDRIIKNNPELEPIWIMHQITK